MTAIFKKIIAVIAVFLQLFGIFQGGSGIKFPDFVQDFIEDVVQSDDEIQAENRKALEEMAKLLGAGDEIKDMSYSELQALVEELIKKSDSSDESTDTDEPVSPEDNDESKAINYDDKTVLVKVKDSFSSAMLGDLAYKSVEALYKGSKWYSVKLADSTNAEKAVAYLSGLNAFEGVDYDYVMGTTANESDNPNYDQQTNLGLSNIPHGWTHNGKHPGGSPDVVVAVIDTGVDYRHSDLSNNIWVNSAEIPDNGKDDDKNGYIDDIYGWDFVGNDKDPIDDNGHGTHVAGIIAAENNKQGGIGVAYNSKVMVLKAGNSSGYFNNSDIAEAVQYAYMNGASVINMSFGGSQISIAVEEALQDAYNACVLVAAAGNDGACNDLTCPTCDFKKVSYPAALPYVIGVMSTDKDGKHISSFSNYDHNPYNSIEYEVYAVGEGVGSTWPSDKYACLSGTSMAAPTVSGIAALLRSECSDREVYSTKFIQSQIVNTGTVNLDGAHTVADVQEALNKLPKPEVNLYDYSIDDSTAINSKNNGNGVIDAGETVRLYFSLHNRGGVATDVNVSIDTDRGMGMPDPYFTFVNYTLQLSDIGTYSERDSGDKYFEIAVSPDCPNDYLVDFNIRYTYKNGMDASDKTAYAGDAVARFNVSSGYCLPSVITEDTVFTNDRLYIIGEDVIIPEGVTVTFEEGCQIQFYDDREYYYSPMIKVFGTLNMLGSKEHMIDIFPSEQYSTFICPISNCGTLNISYVNAVNLIAAINEKYKQTAVMTITDSYLKTNGEPEYNTSSGMNYIDRGYSNNLSALRSFLGMSVPVNAANTENSYLYRNYIEVDIIYYDVTAGVAEGNIFLVGNSYSNNLVTRLAKNNIFLFCRARSSGFKILQGASNNRFVAVNNDINDLAPLVFDIPTNIINNEFSDVHIQYASQIISGYYDIVGNPLVDVFASCSDMIVLYPYVTNVEIFNADCEPIATVGKEEIKVRVTFNRPMDTTKDTYLTFGTIEPYADYKIEGAYVSDTVWEGTYTLKAQIENGQNYLKVNNACAAEDQTKVVFGEYQLHEFTIDTTAALAMNLFAKATDAGIELTWNQDDYDTLMGYNIYRADSKDGNYVKINPSVLLPTDESFLDDNAEPGKTYWYTFTVVLSDFSESAPAGKVYCTAIDTLNPTIYHTPVNQGYAGNNLVISCTASDNIQIANVNLYYRTVGTDAWKTLSMSKVNDKYNATIFGSDLSLDGLEYYIVASDGVNTVTKGSAEIPYTVVIKDASALSRIGDVDGNGNVTTKDALMLMQCLNGDLLLSDDEFKRADLNGDGELSSAEALRILQYINGKVSTLEM